MKVIVRPPAILALTVSSAVADFAKTHDGVEYDDWHQDDPVWYVHQQRALKHAQITKFVQVALFHDPGPAFNSELAATPGAQLVDEIAGFGSNLERPPPAVTHVISPRQSVETSQVLSMIEQAWASLGKPTDADFKDSLRVALPQAGKR